MTETARRWSILLVLLGGMLAAGPVRAHEGPPFPILVDRPVGPYVASVWTDPDIGKATFFVVLEPPEGRSLPERTRVRIAVQPVTRRLPEVVYEAALQRGRQDGHYFTAVSFDRGEMWRVRVLLDGPQGGGELAAEVEATPAGTIGPVGLLLYPLPFLAMGFLWLKAALRRRARPVPHPAADVAASHEHETR